MKPALIRPRIDSLMRDVLAQPLQPQMLQVFLHSADVNVRYRTWDEVRLMFKRAHEHGARLHFIEGEYVRHFSAQRRQRAGQHREQLPRLAENAPLEPSWTVLRQLLLLAVQFDHLCVELVVRRHMLASGATRRSASPHHSGGLLSLDPCLHFHPSEIQSTVN